LEHTLTLVKFKDRVDTLRGVTSAGALPKELAIGGNVRDVLYFDAVTMNIADIDKVSPVTLDNLRNTLRGLGGQDFTATMEGVNPETKEIKLGVLHVATELLESLGSKLLSPDANPFDKRKTAWETTVYLESLTDVLGEKRRGPNVPPGGARALEDYYKGKVTDFEKRAGDVVRKIENDRPEERWERKKK
jgi:hypothetical protein